MSNSPLVVYTKISPNKNSPRNHVIDTITIHVVEGQVTAERLGETFASPDRNASSNYGVDKDGRIALYVEEKDRAWTSSSAANDHRAITIEVASNTTPPYWVNEKAMAGLINLLVDICQRNNIPKLLWKNDPNLIGQIDKQNMTVHRWFASTSCPGEYMMEQMGEIANKVNARLGVEEEKEEEKEEDSTATFKVGDKVVIKPGAVYINNVAVPSSCIGVKYTVGKILEDRCLLTEITSWVANKYLSLANEKTEVKKEEPKKDPVTTNPTKPTVTESSAKIKKGDLVSIASGAVYTNGVAVPYSIRTNKWYVSAVNGSIILIDKNDKGNRSINSTINEKFLTVVGASANTKPTLKTPITVGDKVKIKPNALYSNGVKVPSSYTNIPYTVSQIDSKKTKALIKELNSWVAITYLTK